MGTPDLTDAYGVFSYYTSDPFEDYPNLSGGTVHTVDVTNNVVRAEIFGPVNSLRTQRPTDRDPYANTTRVPFTVHLDPNHDHAVRLDIQGQTILLTKGEYSPVKLKFDLLPVIGAVSGIARSWSSSAPHFQLYVRRSTSIQPSRLTG
jgi:hypothetical protein